MGSRETTAPLPVRGMRRRAGAIVVDGDHVLMMGQNEVGDDPHRWYHFPGGGIEPGETEQAAAVRELFEETGIVARCGPKLAVVYTGAYQHNYFLMDADDLTLGPCTGPETFELAEELGFAPEWLERDGLLEHAVWPRVAVEQLLRHLGGAPLEEPCPVFDEERMSWEGVRATGPRVRRRACVVLVQDGHVALIERVVGGDRYFTVPGGGVEAGESVVAAATREAMEELGVTVSVGARLAVVEHAHSIQTYFWCAIEGGRFGSGTGDEFGAPRRAARGTYTPRWVAIGELDADNLRPSWLPAELPRWIADPHPPHPDYFFEG